MTEAVPGVAPAEVLGELTARFRARGIRFALISGLAYGLYSAFVTLGMSRGIWTEWYGPASGLSVVVTVYLLGVLGAGVNDLASAVWATGFAARSGKLVDVWRCVRSKPGGIMLLCAVVGGPIGGAAYIIALQLAGPIIIPITALCPAIGALIGRVVLKQPLTLRMVSGILLCFTASVAIGWTGVNVSYDGTVILGLVFALVAAVAWAVEGAIAGFGTALIDYEIGIVIRQWTSGLLNLVVVLPIIALVAGNMGLAPSLLGRAITDGPSIWAFVLSGFFSLFAFSLWYKGNSMCGAALGMAANGTYAFWGPFFCWLVLGVVMQLDGWTLAPVAWVGAAVMTVGILLIAANPLDLVRRRTQQGVSS